MPLEITEKLDPLTWDEAFALFPDLAVTSEHLKEGILGIDPQGALIWILYGAEAWRWNPAKKSWVYGRI